LQALELLIELLIAVLQLLHLTGEIADRLLEAVEAGHQIARHILRMRGLRRRYA
jgi:2-methylcitrate dehydratase PrpD